MTLADDRGRGLTDTSAALTMLAASASASASALGWLRLVRDDANR
jgi:hypothetical protein